MYRQFLALQQASRRMICSSARRQVENKVPEKQKLFQEDNGMPIHLKGGTRDALLYRLTMVLTVLGENKNQQTLRLPRTRVADPRTKVYLKVFWKRGPGAGYVVYELCDAAFPKKP